MHVLATFEPSDGKHFASREHAPPDPCSCAAISIAPNAAAAWRGVRDRPYRMLKNASRKQPTPAKAAKDQL